MKNIFKKFLTLALATLLTASAVITVGAGNVLTDKDLVGGNIFGGYYPNYSNAHLNVYTRCPECRKACYEFVSVVEGCTLYTYMCTTHGLVTPVEVTPDDFFKPVPPTEDDSNKEGDYVINAVAGIGGTITLNNNKPIKKWDSRIVYITPNYGYICSAVYVNGFYVGATDKLELNYINKDYSIIAFFKPVNTKRDNAVVITTVGGGSVTAKLNNKNIGEISSTTIKYKDTLDLSFDADKNYDVVSVKVNGIEQGVLDKYTLSKLYYDVKVEVTFKWKNPWIDVDKHLEAVEYVTTNGIMGSPNQFMNTDEFQGDKKVNNYLLCAFLAEMVDSADVLNEHKERVEWMKKMEVIPADMIMTNRPTYAQAAEIVMSFLRMIEKENDITFTALKNSDTAADVAKALGFYSEKTFENTRISRYDVAEICYAIAQLESK